MPRQSYTNKARAIGFTVALMVLPITSTWAAYCEGASHIGCHEGIDQSGRSPGALYDAAVEGLSEARTPGERALAQKAMKDVFTP